MRDAPASSDSDSTSSTPASAPAKAMSGVLTALMGVSAQAMVTARPALAFTPMMFGAASGLHSTVWITAPATASALPASSAAAVRGRRV